MKVVLFGSSSCMPCKMVKKALETKKIDYDYEDVASSVHARASEITVTPSLLDGDTLIEGFGAISAFIKNK